MAQYRCAACGSKNVVTDTETSGVKYNYVKGAVGTVVLGVGGAAAGIESKTHQVYKCAACGLSLTYTMPEGMKDAIDLGVEDAEARNRLSFNGVPVFWDYLTTKYPNIERGAADAAIEKKQQQFATKEAFYADLFEKMIAYVNTPVEFDIPSWDEEAQKAWEAQFGDTWKNREEEISKLIHRNKEANEILKEEIQEKIAAVQKEHDALKQAIANMESELSSLGVFKMKEKKALSVKIEDQKKVLADCNPSKVKWSEEEREKRLQKVFDEDCRKKCLEVWNRYDIPASPKSQFEVHKFLEPLRIQVGEGEISGASSEKVDGLKKQIKKAVDAFEMTHPLVSGFDSIREFQKQSTMQERLAVQSDCDRYTEALVCLLVLVTAKQPILASDVILLCMQFGISPSMHFESDREDMDGEPHPKGYDDRNEGCINHGFITLKGLGLAECLCLTPFHDSEPPKLHNTKRMGFGWRCDTVMVAKL